MHASTSSFGTCPDASRATTAVDELEREVRNLRRALETREVIGIAEGIIIAHKGCRPSEAFEILRRASQRENRKVVDLARQIVGRAAT